MSIKNIFTKNKAIIGATAIVCACVGYGFTKDEPDDFETIKNLEIFHTLLREVRVMYVDKPNSEKLIHTAIDKMLESLDPYTVYYPESLVEDVRFMNTGEYAGIGAEIEKINDSYTVMTIIKDSPADKVGIMIGDIILKINNIDIKNKTTDEADLLIKGQPGSTAQLLIQRGNETKTIGIKRNTITVNCIPFYGVVDNNIGYINLSGFTEKSSSEFKEAFINLKNNHNISKLIIDLRYNPGGLLVEAVKIVNMFVAKGSKIVEMKGRVENWNKTFNAESQPIDLKIPIVVLVNGQSASAAEIVSGSLQDLDRAVIIGEKTYGKGLVQTTRDLAYNAKCKITTAKYLIPSGRCIQRVDYSKKDESGKSEVIADSLVKTFKTKNGRPVKDAGGILPDIIINNDTIEYAVENLIDKNIIFNFVNDYCRKNSKPQSLKSITVDDKIIEELKIYAGKELYNYTTRSEEDLKVFEQSLEEDYHSQELKNQIAILKQSIQKHKKISGKEIDRQLKAALGSEIAMRFFYEEGEIEYSLQNDKYNAQAIEILNNEDLYKKILAGEKR